MRRTAAHDRGGRASPLAAKGWSFAHEELTLSNGLRVVMTPRPGLHTVAVALHLGVGSRFETRATNGLSHFLEHMLYRGTPSHATAHEQSLAFERLGGMLYAATATDHGLMSISLPSETACEAVRLLGEVAQRPVFSSIDVERRIIEEEILEDLDDDGRQIDPDNLSRELLYGNHPLGLPITGTIELLRGFDVAALVEHHGKFYGASNAVLSVAGAFEVGAMRAAIEGAFGGMPAGERATPLPAPQRPPKKQLRYVESDGSQTDLRVAFRGPGDHDPLEPAVEVLLRVIDDGMSTRLYEQLCDEFGLCYDVSAAYEAFCDDGVFDFAAESHHRRAGTVIEHILSLCGELVEHGPTEAELDKVRSRAIWGTRSMLDDPSELAGFYGLARLAAVAPTPDARCEQLLAVTREQVRAAAELVFRPDRLGVVAVGVLDAGERRSLAAAIKRFGA